MSTEGQEPKSICFPSEWHFDVREYPFPLPLLQIDGAKAKYIGPGNSDWEAAAVRFYLFQIHPSNNSVYRTNHPVPETCPFYYYEITVLDEGNLGYIGWAFSCKLHNGFKGMGFCGENVNMARLPGWERHSYGYHGDDGNKFSGLAMGGFYGPTYTTRQLQNHDAFELELQMTLLDVIGIKKSE